MLNTFSMAGDPLYWDSTSGEDIHVLKTEVHEGNKTMFMDSLLCVFI